MPILVAVAFAIGCSAALDPDELDNGVCDDGEKACTETCVEVTNPNYGCSSSTCTPCTLENAAATCDPSGRCAIASCLADFRDCDGRVDTGCEVDIKHNPDFCGGCDEDPCVFDHATPGCGAGVCTILTCDDGWDDCNDMRDDGCETEVNTVDRCGDCETACDAGQACVDGMCM